MLSGFLFLTLIILLVGIVSVYMLNRVNGIADFHKLINQLQVHTLNLIKADNDFFDFESTNEKYFETHQSRFLDTRDSLVQIIKNEMEKVRNQMEENNYPFVEHVMRIDSIFSVYNYKFRELENLVFVRGYKDYGLEGEMRMHAHALEIPLYRTTVLFLRRNEKDFFLRHDTAYWQKFKEVSDMFMSVLKSKTPVNAELVSHLNAYTTTFRQRVELEKKIGLGSLAGVRNDLNNLTFAFGRHYFTLNELSGSLYVSIKQKASLFYVLTFTGAILFSILSGLWISKQLSAPIASLSKMANSVAADLSEPGALRPGNAADEIKVLASAYVSLIDQRNRQLRVIEEKSFLLKSHNDELDKLNTELDNFLYSTAHDLRSPLASLSGLIRLMKLENTQDNFNTYLEMMQRSIERQEDFISQIVSYSKNKKLDIHPESLDLKEMIENIFQDNEFVTGGAQIQKFVGYKNDAPFYSDRNRIQVIFNNLISNGIRYADFSKEEQIIEMKIWISEAEAVIEYSDNGVGIAAHHLEKIFDMFYRANVQSKGSGLGLFILREAVHKLQGQVSVESEEKVGTTFTIKLKNLVKPAKERAAIIDSRGQEVIELT